MISHLFLNCIIASSLWGKLCTEAKISWVILASCDALLTENVFAFGKVRKAKSLCKCVVAALLGVVWQERNSRIFEEKREEVLSGLWDKIHFVASPWVSVRISKTLLSSSSISIRKGFWVNFYHWGSFPFFVNFGRNIVLGIDRLILTYMFNRYLL